MPSALNDAVQKFSMKTGYCKARRKGLPQGRAPGPLAAHRDRVAWLPGQIMGVDGEDPPTPVLKQGPTAERNIFGPTKRALPNLSHAGEREKGPLSELELVEIHRHRGGVAPGEARGAVAAPVVHGLKHGLDGEVGQGVGPQVVGDLAHLPAAGDELG